MNHSFLPEPYSQKLNVAIAEMKGLKRIASEMTTRAETAERQVRDLTLELSRMKARAKTAEAQLASPVRTCFSMHATSCST